MNDGPVQVYQLWQKAVAAFVKLGLRYVVLSPGSRCAPVSLSFLRNKEVECLVVPDERSAAFMALGLAQMTQRPVAMVCTSGTAALNYAPAIAEAYFQKVPLICITADRPQEWLGQADNQAIYQVRLYGRHVLGSLEMPLDLQNKDARWHALRLISEAWNIANGPQKGPVHLNVPLREPLYIKEQLPLIPGAPKVFIANTSKAASTGQVEHFNNLLLEAQKIMVVAGLLPPSSNLAEAASKLAANPRIVFIPDVASNLLPEQAILHSDLFLSSQKPGKDFAPDLLVTLGGPVVSKKLKQFLRDHSPQRHIHIAPAGEMTDTFQSLTEIIATTPDSLLLEIPVQDEAPSAFKSLWLKTDQVLAEKSINALKDFGWNDLVATNIICQNLPEQSILHLGNSLPVRLVNLAGLEQLKRRMITVFTNRGTSGIDGSLSSAVGNALATSAPVTAVLGDMSFFYDRNALWHQYLPSNLRIIVLNNNGGGIFRNIPGPAMQQELELFFAAGQELSCKHTALQHGLDYLNVASSNELSETLNSFYADSQVPRLLEVELPARENGKFLRKFFEM